MQAPDPIEAALNRLIPVAFSDSGLRSLEDTLDELAASAPVSAPAPSARAPRLRFLIASGIAASIAALIPLLPGSHPSHTPVQLTFIPLPEPDTSGLVLVSESERIESMTDEGWVSDPDGTAMHAFRIRTVGENQIRDSETGIEFQITEPREEILLMPVSSF
jgi:hypothetical protein